MAAERTALHDLASVMAKVPQLIVSVPGFDRCAAWRTDEVEQALVAAEARLGDTGGVRLRPSGTEPVIRLLVESPDAALAAEISRNLSTTIAGALATGTSRSSPGGGPGARPPRVAGRG
ncbi:hypothetical protein [Streptomyces sp. G-G2]|uniref:hypothetical protein n=1 Tax=Streptomyces sp. G-G2 TaxID=3046201 RepID=UPI0024BB43F6|nr:hypothetical protein [Streptomyces sp. G-G2]MDJ0384765.1 hypothetical protein [Streptomyces sp. G-G2]